MYIFDVCVCVWPHHTSFWIKFEECSIFIADKLRLTGWLDYHHQCMVYSKGVTSIWFSFWIFPIWLPLFPCPSLFSLVHAWSFWKIYSSRLLSISVCAFFSILCRSIWPKQQPKNCVEISNFLINQIGVFLTVYTSCLFVFFLSLFFAVVESCYFSFD